MYTFGNNERGQLGTGDLISTDSPFMPILPKDKNAVDIFAGYNRTAAILGSAGSFGQGFTFFQLTVVARRACTFGVKMNPYMVTQKLLSRAVKGFD